jgi:hypothetical protein
MLLHAGGTWTATAGSINSHSLFNANPTLTNSGAQTIIPGLFGVVLNPTITAAVAGSIYSGGGFRDAPIFNVSGGGTWSTTNPGHVSFRSAPNAGTVGATSNVIAFSAQATAGAGTLGTHIGLDVGALTAGTEAAALRSAIAAGSGKFFLEDTGGAQSSLVGKFTKYNNVTTAGFGVPAIVDRQALTGKVADVTDTAFTNAGTAGEYVVHVYVLDTTSAIGAGAVTVNIKFNDGTSAQTVTVGPVALTSAGTFAQGTVFAHLGSGSVTYGTTHTGIFSTAVYALYVTADRLN